MIQVDIIQYCHNDDANLMYRCFGLQFLIGMFEIILSKWSDMEDAHTHILSLSEDREAAFFAVYDGHGGVKVAQYAGANLHKNIVAQSCYSKNAFSKSLFCLKCPTALKKIYVLKISIRASFSLNLGN